MKYLILALFLLPLSPIFAQSKWNFGVAMGASSKLHLGIPQKYHDGVSQNTEISPFEVFLNGGISGRYKIGQKYFLQADILAHRMDITYKWSSTFYSYNDPYRYDQWTKTSTSYKFIQTPITFNKVWDKKKMQPFIGIGIAPTYILSAQNTELWGSAYKGTGGEYTRKTSLLNYDELQGIRRLKMPFAYEIGFQPFKRVTFSVRNSVGAYKFLGYSLYKKGFDVYGYSQSTNMFSFIAKIYLRK